MNDVCAIISDICVKKDEGNMVGWWIGLWPHSNEAPGLSLRASLCECVSRYGLKRSKSHFTFYFKLTT